MKCLCNFEISRNIQHKIDADYLTCNVSVDIYRVYKKNATSEFPKKSTLQFLSIKDVRPLGIEIELLVDHIITVVVLYL